MTGTDKNADHAAALYGDMHKPAAPAPASSDTKPWDAIYGDSMAEKKPDAPGAATMPPPRTVQDSPFDAIYGDAHREPAPEQFSVEQLLAEPQSVADAIYPEGGRPLDSADDYSRQALSEGFDAIQTQARHDQNAEETAALDAGRQEAAALLHEWAVPSEAARGIALELDGFNRRWINGDLPTDDELDSSRQKTENALRKEWGPKYDANVELARQTYKEAAKRLPWLRNLVEDTGAGNSPMLIRHFATVGLKNARNRRGTGKNR